jgi:hypothetical protein
MGRLALPNEVLGRACLVSAADPRFVIDEFEPGYRRLDSHVLAIKVDAALAELHACRACPRNCGVDRTAGELGTCNTGRHAGFDELMPKTIANATVDRLMHHAHVVLTAGDPIRLTQATAGKGVTPLTHYPPGRTVRRRRAVLLATTGQIPWPPLGRTH